VIRGRVNFGPLSGPWISSCLCESFPCPRAHIAGLVATSGAGKSSIFADSASLGSTPPPAGGSDRTRQDRPRCHCPAGKLSSLLASTKKQERYYFSTNKFPMEFKKKPNKQRIAQLEGNENSCWLYTLVSQDTFSVSMPRWGEPSPSLSLKNRRQ